MQVSGELRMQAIRILSVIAAFKDEGSESDGVYLTSAQEFALAVYQRDQYETILPSGVDPFDDTEDKKLLLKNQKSSD